MVGSYYGVQYTAVEFPPNLLLLHMCCCLLLVLPEVCRLHTESATWIARCQHSIHCYSSPQRSDLLQLAVRGTHASQFQPTVGLHSSSWCWLVWLCSRGSSWQLLSKGDAEVAFRVQQRWATEDHYGSLAQACFAYDPFYYGVGWLRPPTPPCNPCGGPQQLSITNAYSVLQRGKEVRSVRHTAGTSSYTSRGSSRQQLLVPAAAAGH